MNKKTIKPGKSVLSRDPEPLILILSIISGLGGLAAIGLYRQNRREQEVTQGRQIAIRRSAKKALMEIWSALREWRAVSHETKEILESSRVNFDAEFRFGASPIYLTPSELGRFQRLMDRIHRIQKTTTRGCAILSDKLERLEPLSRDEANAIERLRDRIGGVVERFNNQVFSSYDDRSVPFRTQGSVLEAIDILINEAAGTLRELEAIMGQQYDL